MLSVYVTYTLLYCTTAFLERHISINKLNVFAFFCPSCGIFGQMLRFGGVVQLKLAQNDKLYTKKMGKKIQIIRCLYDVGKQIHCFVSVKVLF